MADLMTRAQQWLDGHDIDGHPTRETELIRELVQALAEAATQPLDVEQLRASLHGTYNGGWHHSKDGLEAFHHGMDTVCNVLANWQKKQGERAEAAPAPNLFSVQRYDLLPVTRCYVTCDEMERSDDGEWVRFEDVVKSLGEGVRAEVAPASGTHGRIEAYRVEPETEHGGEWHVLVFEDGWQRQVYTDRPTIVVEPEKH